MTNDFKPYTPEESYTVVLSKDEALLVQRIREVGYGTVTIHIVASKIIRVENTTSELAKDRRKDIVKIALEVVSN